MFRIFARVVCALALFTVSAHDAASAVAATPIYDGLVSGVAVQIIHGVGAVTKLLLAPYVLFWGVK